MLALFVLQRQQGQNYEQLTIFLLISALLDPGTGEVKSTTPQTTPSIEEAQWPEERAQPYPELLK